MSGVYGVYAELLNQNPYDIDCVCLRIQKNALWDTL